jgi:hypothetical protein
MIGIAAALLGLVLRTGAVPEATITAPGIAPAAFRGWFDAASRGRLRIPGDTLRRARGFRYVFVGGFRGERMRGYFAQNTAELKALGVPGRAIHVVHPGSDRTVEENRGEVRREFLRIAGEGPERLVVVAHSRGACDALAFALGDPGFVRDRVEALFLIQGPFGGTGLADYALGEGEPMDRRMPPAHRLLAYLIGRRERALLGRGRHGGLAGLTLASSRAYWRRALAEHAEAIPLVGPKVYYVESATRPGRLRLFLRAAAWYLGTYYGPNDGVVAAGDQSLAGLGTSLATLDAGHADLTRRGPATRAGRRIRRALVRSIVMAVGRGGTERPPDVVRIDR